MKIAILGFDTEGRASYDYFKQQGHELEIRDQNLSLEVPAGVTTLLGSGYLNDLNKFDLLMRTAGLPPRKILEKNPGVQAKISSHVNEFMKAVPTQNIIGVTGTKGKGTTSTLIAEMLKAAGKDVWLGGNIGVPPLEFIEKLAADSWVVLELSSFQLIDLQASPHIAVCLMVVPEHLDWHKDLAEYSGAKLQLFAHQKPADIAIYYAKNDISRRLAEFSAGHKLPYFEPPGATVQGNSIVIDGQTICQTNELKLLGKHNWQNVCAAVTAAWQVNQGVEPIRQVLTTFAGLPHRIELVREFDGVRYYDDSFSTGLKSTEAAIEAIDGKKVMIIGGYDRHLGIDFFGDYAHEHQDEFRKILLIGETAEVVATVLTKAGFDDFIVGNDLKDTALIVQRARSLAEPGDAVVLSPGFASFDMFKNFEDRGQQFKAEVSKL